MSHFIKDILTAIKIKQLLVEWVRREETTGKETVQEAIIIQAGGNDDLHHGNDKKRRDKGMRTQHTAKLKLTGCGNRLVMWVKERRKSSEFQLS